MTEQNIQNVVLKDQQAVYTSQNMTDILTIRNTIVTRVYRPASVHCNELREFYHMLYLRFPTRHCYTVLKPKTI